MLGAANVSGAGVIDEGVNIGVGDIIIPIAIDKPTAVTAGPIRREVTDLGQCDTRQTAERRGGYGQEN